MKGLSKSTEGSIEVAKCSDLIDGSATWQVLSVRYNAVNHVFCPITRSQILIMYDEDVSIFDTMKNTIENVGTNTFELQCMNNNFTMSRDGQVIALVIDQTNDLLKAVHDRKTWTVQGGGLIKVVSFTKGEQKVREIKRFGKLY